MKKIILIVLINTLILSTLSFTAGGEIDPVTGACSVCHQIKTFCTSEQCHQNLGDYHNAVSYLRYNPYCLFNGGISCQMNGHIFENSLTQNPTFIFELAKHNFYCELRDDISLDPDATAKKYKMENHPFIFVGLKKSADDMPYEIRKKIENHPADTPEKLGVSQIQYDSVQFEIKTKKIFTDTIGRDDFIMPPKPSTASHDGGVRLSEYQLPTVQRRSFCAIS